MKFVRASWRQSINLKSEYTVRRKEREKERDREREKEGEGEKIGENQR